MESRRLRLRVAYDGRPFRGWQSQSGGGAVQDHLETAFARLCAGGVDAGAGRIVVHGAGRTDAGVHARGQVAHADVPAAAAARFSSSAQWIAALNAHLPAEIRVERVRPAPAGFHARFSACGKLYRYRIWNAPVLSPFELGRAWHLPGALDFPVLQAAARQFVGRHDFAAFAANRRPPQPALARDTVRTLRRVAARRAGALVTLDFQGDGFLYKQVRLMTGTLARVAQGKLPLARIGELLAAPAGQKTSFAAPAEGLFLLCVIY